MPEVIFTCPLCGREPKVNRGCGVVTCCEISVDDVGAWNALPRALTWTNEPPKVAGWYWWRTSKGQNVNTIQVWSRSGVLGYCFDTEFITALDRGEWAGPIPAPID